MSSRLAPEARRFLTLRCQSMADLTAQRSPMALTMRCSHPGRIAIRLPRPGLGLKQATSPLPMVKPQTSTCAWEAILVLRLHQRQRQHLRLAPTRNSYCHGNSNCDRDSHGHCDGYSQRLQLRVQLATATANGNCDRDGNSNTDALRQPAQSAHAWATCERQTKSGPLLERGVFEPGRHLSQRRVDQLPPRMTVSYTDRIGGHGPGSFTYRVCNAGTQTCSNNATVNF